MTKKPIHIVGRSETLYNYNSDKEGDYEIYN